MSLGSMVMPPLALLMLRDMPMRMSRPQVVTTFENASRQLGADPVPWSSGAVKKPSTAVARKTTDMRSIVICVRNLRRTGTCM